MPADQVTISMSMCTVELEPTSVEKKQVSLNPLKENPANLD